MSEHSTPLAKIQDLYLLQMELWSFLDAARPGKVERANAKRALRAFMVLLRQADWRYMGGEDVLASMRWIPKEVNAKLKKRK